MRSIVRFVDSHPFSVLAMVELPLLIAKSLGLSWSWWLILIPAWLAIALFAFVVGCFLWYALS